MGPARSSAEHLKPILREVVVEGESGRDPQPLHHREARRVGEREVLVVLLVDDLPSPLLITIADPHDSSWALVDLIQKGRGHTTAKALSSKAWVSATR